MEIVATVVGAIVLGLATVAYRHPSAYKGLCNFIQGVMGALFVGLVLWDIAGMQMHTAMLPYFDRGKLDAAKTAAEAMMVLNWKWYSGFLCTWLYLSFLCALPLLGIVARGSSPEPAAKAATTEAATASEQRPTP